MQVPKLAEVFPLRPIKDRADAMRYGDEWQARARHLEEYALTLDLLLSAYKLQLRVAEREIERLRGLIG